MRDQHTSYYMAFLEERGLNQGGQLFDPVDMNLYVCKRLQMDNDWLVSQLAEAQARNIDTKPFEMALQSFGKGRHEYLQSISVHEEYLQKNPTLGREPKISNEKYLNTQEERRAFAS